MAKEMQHSELFTPAVAQWESRNDVRFGDLVNAVKNVHHSSHQAAVKAVNRYATMRNWLIGFFIVEYQQKGRDRAQYGEKLLKRLEDTLNTRGLNVTLFRNCRQSLPATHKLLNCSKYTFNQQCWMILSRTATL